MTERIIWADIESTGLNPKRDALLEVAVLVTEKDLTPVDEGISVVLSATEAALAGMDLDVRPMHTQNGLLDEVQESTLGVEDAERLLVDYVASHVRKGWAPLAGSNIKFDRIWLAVWMPNLSDWPHYRDICVSTLKETARRFFPQVHRGRPVKNYAHRGMDDVHESIIEYYSYLVGIGAQLPPLAVSGETGRLLSPADGLQRISFASGS